METTSTNTLAKPIKIYHGPSNTAGIAGILPKAERALSADSFSFCFIPKNRHNKSADRLLDMSNLPRAILEWGLFLLLEGWKFDIYHFYFGRSLTGNLLFDIPFLKIMRKKIFFYFHGCDVRDRNFVIKKYTFSACKYCAGGCSPNRIKALAMSRRYANGIFVSTPDLIEFVPGSIFLPQAIDLDELNQFKHLVFNQVKPKNNIMTIVHAPTDRLIKGTSFIIQAVEDLQNQGYAIELKLIENISYLQALTLYAAADIAVDQLLIGAYGTFSIEMMALGKPVICYIRDDIRQYYPQNLPIISANPTTLRQVLLDLYHQKEQWTSIGEAGTSYVKEVHDSMKIARKTLDYYQKL